MNIDDALNAIADYLHLDSALLAQYASEDDIGGYHTDTAQQRFPVGSLWAVDGQALYALVRALKPLSLLELGVRYGASTTHLRTAVQANDRGHVQSVDIWAGAGDMIPAALETYGTLTFTDGAKFIETLPGNSVDFVFEDMLHSREQVYEVTEALRPKLKAGALVVHHDSEHGDEGRDIIAGIRDAGITDYLSVLIEPSDCGLALWKWEGE